MGSGIIDAGDDSRGIWEFVLLKKPVETLLEDFFVSDGTGEGGQHQK